MTAVASAVPDTARSLRRSPVTVVIVVLALYVSTFAGLLATGTKLVTQAQVGKYFLDAGAGHSESIDALRPYAHSRIGYDGQFALFTALSPTHAAAYMDDPAYRYERILYPMVARSVAAGQPAAIPWTLILVNLAAAISLTLLVAVYLGRRGTSPWYALVIGLNPGLVISAFRDLNEPLAYALVALGMLALWTGARHSVVVAGLAFALATLTRESAAVFAVSVAACLALGIGEQGSGGKRRVRDAVTLVAMTCIPFFVWKTVLGMLTGGASVPAHVRPELVPFRGLLGRSPFDGQDVRQLLLVAVPGCLAVVIALLLTRRVTAPLVALCANWLLVLALLPSDSFQNVPTAARVSMGVPLAFVYCVPQLRGRKLALLALAPVTLWMLAWA